MQDKTPNLVGDGFAEEIQRLVKENNLSYMDAVIHWCDKNTLEVDIGAELVSKNPAIKFKIEEEAEKLNFIKRKSNRLF